MGKFLAAAILAAVLLGGANAQAQTTTTSTSSSTTTSTSSTTSTTLVTILNRGVLISSQATTGAGNVQVHVPEGPASVIDFDIQITGTGTVTIEQRLSATGASWQTVGTKSASGMVTITDPLGKFRPNVTNCSTCTATVVYQWK